MSPPKDSKPLEEGAPEQTPEEKMLAEAPKDVQPYLKIVTQMYEKQLGEKNTDIVKANKLAQEYKSSRDIVQAQVNDKTKEVTGLKQKVTEADKWYNHWYVKLPTTLAFLTLGFLVGDYYEAKLGQSGKLSRDNIDLSSQLNDYKKEGTLEEFRKGKESKGNLVKENQKYKSDNDKLEQVKWDLQEKLSESDKNNKKLISDLNKNQKEKEACEGDLTKEEDMNKELQEKYKVLAQEHEKCKDKIFVNVENRGTGLTQKLETMRPYLKSIAKEFGYDEYDVGEILVNIDANYDGKITKDEQMPVDFYLKSGYKYVLGIVTKEKMQKANELGIAGSTLNFADNEFPLYDENDVETKRAIKIAKSEISEIKTRTVFSKTDFKNLCAQISGAQAIIGDDGVTVRYNGKDILAYLNKPKSEIENWNYLDINNVMIYNIQFEGWGPKECLGALKDYLSSIAPQNKE